VTLRLSDARRAWWTLGGACTGLFVLMLDSTIVALALPAIRDELGVSATGLQWVMNGYLLVIAALVVTGGGWATCSGAGPCSRSGS